MVYASHHWWGLALRGVFSVIFGVLALLYPGITVAALAVIFGAYALVDGIFALVAAIANHHSPLVRTRGALAALGVLGIVVGLITFSQPGVTMLALAAFLGIWMIARGALEVAVGIMPRMDHRGSGDWLLGVLGVASVVFGVLVIAEPVAGIVALAWLLAFYAFGYGALLLAASLRTRKLERTLSAVPSPEEHRLSA